jgi:hypothetical protein
LPRSEGTDESESEPKPEPKDDETAPVDETLTLAGQT